MAQYKCIRDPGPPPDPPDRVRARPVLHLEEPAATLAMLTVVLVLLVSSLA